MMAFIKNAIVLKRVETKSIFTEKSKSGFLFTPHSLARITVNGITEIPKDTDKITRTENIVALPLRLTFFSFV